MFRPTDRQTSMFESHLHLPEDKRKRLEQSWAHGFRTRVMPHVDEEVFRDAFDADNGRPNFSIRVLVGLHLLKDAHDLTDGQALEQFEYNLQWHYALEVRPEQAHVSRRTLLYFRERLMDSDRAQRMFQGITERLAAAEGVRTGRQRLDSTHVLSNIALLTRLGLFCRTVEHFLEALRNAHPERVARLPDRFGRRYLDREGYFSDATKEQARRRLPEVAIDVAELVARFGHDEQVAALDAFATLRRLFDEQIELVEPDDDPDGGGAGNPSDEGEGDNASSERLPSVQLRDPKTISGTSLQSPHDPDATYGHKGKGYLAQLAETCDTDNPLQLITAVAVNGTNESDQAATLPMVEQLQAGGLGPQELIADTGYGSGANIVQCADLGVQLLAPVPDPKAPTRVDRFVVAGETVTAGEDCETAHCAALPAADAPLDEVRQWMAAQLGGAIDLAAFAFTAGIGAVLACAADHEPLRQQLTGQLLSATFSAAHCADCPLAGLCPTVRLADGSRQLRRSRASIATESRQHEQKTAAFKESYRIRSGIEATNSTLKRRHGLRKLRVRGRGRVELAVTLKALSLNGWRVAQHHANAVRQAKGERKAA